MNRLDVATRQHAPRAKPLRYFSIFSLTPKLRQADDRSALLPFLHGFPVLPLFGAQKKPRRTAASTKRQFVYRAAGMASANAYDVAAIVLTIAGSSST